MEKSSKRFTVKLGKLNGWIRVVESDLLVIPGFIEASSTEPAISGPVLLNVTGVRGTTFLGQGLRQNGRPILAISLSSTGVLVVI